MGRSTTPGRGAQDVEVAAGGEHRRHEAVQRGGVTLYGGAELEPLSAAHHRHPVHSEVPADEHGIPDAGAARLMSTPWGMTPIPAVLMYTPSPLPRSTTFVSPVTSLTPATRAAAPTCWAIRPSSSSPVPSCRMYAVDMNSGTAPDMARSLTVPFTARSPIDPPGKN